MEELFTGADGGSGALGDHDGYDGVMAGLSDPQRRAVRHEGGPLIVLAGPGTGKTRVITARVACMIRERGIDPERVAAVTFTNKAAGELGTRLAGLVGDTVAARVRASTFHSLGQGILRRFGDVLGLGSEMVLIDSAQRNTLVAQIIREAGLYRASMGRGIERARDHAVGVMDALRNLGWWPDQASRWSAQRRGLIEQLEGGARDEAHYELERFDDAVAVYQRFTGRCVERGWLVFDDLIMLPTRLINEHERIASIVRYEHAHVVVDEFQDVNPAQIGLIRALCPPASGPDVCVVGDDDQSIYGFRGADDRAFAHFASIWDVDQTVELTTNYRSADCVVRAGNAVIANATLRFAPDKRGDSFRGQVDGSGIELVRVDSDLQIGEAVAAMLLRLIDEGGAGVDLGQIAVIARTNPELERIARMLELEGIPFTLRERRAPMDDQGARDVLAWARVLTQEKHEPELMRLLTRGPYRCPAVALRRLAGHHAAQRSRFAQGDEGADDPGALLGWLCACADAEIARRATALATLAGELGAIAAQQPAGTALVEIIKRTGVMHRDLEDGHTRARRVEALAAIVRFARSRADRFDEPGDLASFVRYYDLLDRNEQSLGDLPEQRVAGGSETENDEEGEGSSGRVMLLTAHASKGLEFETVVIPRVTSPHGYPKMSGTSDGEGLPGGLIDRADDPRDEKGRRYDEERRVFYVALTRAQRRVVLVGKVPRKTSTVNFALELGEALGEELVQWHSEELVDPARQSDAIRRLGAGFKAASAMHDAFDEARRGVRRAAASALDAMELGNMERDELVERLGHAGREAALIEHVRLHGAMPPWAQSPTERAIGAGLLGVLERQGDPAGGALHPGLVGPQRLSFSKLSRYLHCPRCYLAEFVLRIPDADTERSIVGKAAHEALEQFYTRWREADAEGRPTPGLEALVSLMRERFIASWPKDRSLDADLLDQSVAMMHTAWDRLHSGHAHIIELEREHVLGYECDGVRHEIRARIDRVDATDAGGFRVVDYKTGHPRKDLKEPSGSDLQMGIYAMAVREALGEAGPGSVCEYWLLQEGTVGRIGFDALDMDKIRNKIDKAIRGMMSGDWSRSSQCSGDDTPCAIFDVPGVIFSGQGDELGVADGALGGGSDSF